MDWKPLLIAVVMTVALFFLLTMLWYDLVDDEFFDIRLHTITVTPEGTQ